MARNVEELLKLQPVVMMQLQTIFKKGRLAHAYIFDGDKGVGKTDIMHFFVKLMLCEDVHHHVPCETCRNCRRVNSGNHPNVLQIQPDGQFIKIDQIRDLILEMKMKGMEEGRKIYVLHHADRLNVSSANMLLKFLEEPDGEVTAILLTEQMQSILPTIRSRCQHIKFKTIPRHLLIERLEQAGVSKSIAATVSMLTNEQQVAELLATDEQFAHARKTVLKLIEILQKNVHEALLYIYDEWIPSFKEKNDIEQALDLLLFAYRDIVAIKAHSEGLLTYPDMHSFFRELALKVTYEKLSTQMQAILYARMQLQRNMNRTLMMEQLMLNLQEDFIVV